MARLSTKTHSLLTETVLDTLFNKHIFTITNFVETDIKQLVFITNLTFKNVLTIREHIINKNAAVVKNGLEVLREAVSKNAMLQTGIINIDGILDGGLSTGHIYEICGLPASGKTQFCLTLAKNVVQNSKQQMYYLDTKGDFNATRIKFMLDAHQIENKQAADILRKILTVRIATIYELINVLYHIKSKIREGLSIKLIIIDSLPALLYQFEDSARRNGILNQLVNVMKFLASEYYLCFVVTNIVTTWYEGTFGEDKALTEKIGCGKYWQSVVNTRLKIIKTDNENYEISILKCNEISLNKKCFVSVSDVGMF